MERELARLKPKIAKALKSFPEQEHEDLIAEAMARVWKELEKAGEYASAGKVRSLARWAMQDYLRRLVFGGRRHPTYVESLNVLTDTTRGIPVLQLQSSEQTPEEAVASDEAVKVMLERFGTLKPRDRWILERLSEGSSKTEIAKMLGVTQPRITQIVKRLRKRLGDHRS